MTKDTRLYTLVKTTSKFPKSIRSTLWSKAFDADCDGSHCVGDCDCGHVTDY